MKVNRFTFADWQRVTLAQYRDIHGLIESYGGRVKDYQLNDKDDDKGWGIMFYELGKDIEAPFRQELKELFA